MRQGRVAFHALRIEAMDSARARRVEGSDIHSPLDHCRPQRMQQDDGPYHS